MAEQLPQIKKDYRSNKNKQSNKQCELQRRRRRDPEVVWPVRQGTVEIGQSSQSRTVVSWDLRHQPYSARAGSPETLDLGFIKKFLRPMADLRLAISQSN
ncbi:hypothetical protein RUM44_009463 [Polyplax serrata]|uniref:Uncharacterized protein n=1 Tax=Polyplax serrata TaxID=468196 RepID=A0ABR1ASR8_POLSC